MTKLFRKKKIEIIVEKMFADALIETIEAAGAKGYTLLPKISGKGSRGVRNGNQISDVFSNVMIIVIATEDVALRIIENSQEFLEDVAGIVLVSNVEVVRDDHF